MEKKIEIQVCRVCDIELPLIIKGWLICDKCLDERNTSEVRTYAVSGSINNLNELERLFGCMEGLGDIGSTANIEISYDGDGNAHMDFKRVDKETDLIDKSVEKIDCEEEFEEESLEFSFD